MALKKANKTTTMDEPRLAAPMGTLLWNHAVENAPGLPESCYRLCDQLANLFGSDMISPKVFTYTLSWTVGSLLAGDRPENPTFLKNVDVAKLQKLKLRPEDAKWIVQVVDETTWRRYANEVRHECFNVFGWKIAYRLPIPAEEGFPLAISTALDWLSGSLQLRDGTTQFLNPDMVTTFRQELGRDFAQQLKSHYVARIQNTNVADPSISRAARKAGFTLGDLSTYFRPRTWMEIRLNSVTIGEGESIVAKYALSPDGMHPINKHF